MEEGERGGGKREGQAGGGKRGGEEDMEGGKNRAQERIVKLEARFVICLPPPALRRQAAPSRLPVRMGLASECAQKA